MVTTLSVYSCKWCIFFWWGCLNQGRFLLCHPFRYVCFLWVFTQFLGQTVVDGHGFLKTRIHDCHHGLGFLIWYFLESCFKWVQMYVRLRAFTEPLFFFKLFIGLSVMFFMFSYFLFLLHQAVEFSLCILLLLIERNLFLLFWKIYFCLYCLTLS